MSNTSAIRQQAAHSSYQLSSPSCSKRDNKKPASRFCRTFQAFNPQQKACLSILPNIPGIQPTTKSLPLDSAEHSRHSTHNKKPASRFCRTFQVFNPQQKACLSILPNIPGIQPTTKSLPLDSAEHSRHSTHHNRSWISTLIVVIHPPLTPGEPNDSTEIPDRSLLMLIAFTYR